MNSAEKLVEIAENVPKVYEAGKKAEWSEFWDVVQQNGEKTNYSELFYKNYIFSEETFKPKYDMHCTNANTMFYSWGRYLPTDLIKCFKRQGVVLDTSQATDTQSMFGYAYGITAVPTIDLTSSPESTSQFNYASSLVTIEKLIVTAENTYSNTFNRCSSLENLVIEGTIGQNGFNVQNSPLTHDSLMSIINALADKAGDTSETWTVTLGSSNKNKLTSEELLIAENKGWQVQ